MLGEIGRNREIEREHEKHRDVEQTYPINNQLSTLWTRSEAGDAGQGFGRREEGGRRKKWRGQESVMK